jgi:hypothetical protein
MSMTYKICKLTIENTNYKTQAEKDEMQVKLDVFLLNNRLTQGEYEELTNLLNSKSLVP